MNNDNCILESFKRVPFGSDFGKFFGKIRLDLSFLKDDPRFKYREYYPYNGPPTWTDLVEVYESKTIRIFNCDGFQKFEIVERTGFDDCKYLKHFNLNNIYS
mgnify:FL=1